MQLHRIEPNLQPITLGMLGQVAFGRKQRQLPSLLALFVEGFNDPTPGFLLAVVDLAQIQYRALYYLAATTALALDNTPISVLFAVLAPPMESQIHRSKVYRKNQSPKETWSSLQRLSDHPPLYRLAFSPPISPKIAISPRQLRKSG